MDARQVNTMPIEELARLTAAKAPALPDAVRAKLAAILGPATQRAQERKRVDLAASQVAEGRRAA